MVSKPSIPAPPFLCSCWQKASVHPSAERFFHFSFCHFISLVFFFPTMFLYTVQIKADCSFWSEISVGLEQELSGSGLIYIWQIASRGQLIFRICNKNPNKIAFLKSIWSLFLIKALLSQGKSSAWFMAKGHLFSQQKRLSPTFPSR